MSRTAVLLDALVRAAMVWVLVRWIGNAGETCRPDQFCDDPGFAKVLVAPLALYAVWNVGVFLVAMGFAVRPTMPRESRTLALLSIPRLMLLLELSRHPRERGWPLLALLGVTILSLVLALVAFLREQHRPVDPAS